MAAVQGILVDVCGLLALDPSFLKDGALLARFWVNLASLAGLEDNARAMSLRDLEHELAENYRLTGVWQHTLEHLRFEASSPSSFAAYCQTLRTLYSQPSFKHTLAKACRVEVLLEVLEKIEAAALAHRELLIEMID
jgi:hypothetical protein